MDKKLSRLTTDQRYELVAYVDGELDENATTRIERLLAENAVARTEVESLIATYELLNSLPRPEAPGDFTERTMATARLEEVRPDVTQSPLYRGAQKSIGYLAWIAVMIVAALAGYAVTRFTIPQEHDLLVRDLEVIEQLDKLTEVESVQFLDRLAAERSVMTEIEGEQPSATPR